MLGSKLSVTNSVASDFSQPLRRRPARPCFAAECSLRSSNSDAAKGIAVISLITSLHGLGGSGSAVCCLTHITIENQISNRAVRVEQLIENLLTYRTIGEAVFRQLTSSAMNAPVIRYSLSGRSP